MPSPVLLSWNLLRRVAAVSLVLLLTVLLAGPLTGRANAAETTGGTLGDRTGYAVGGNLQDRSPVELARELDLAVASGARWIRLDVNWASTERVRGQRDWSAMDRVVAAINSRGIEILGLVTYAPSWARAAGSEHHAPPTDPNAFADFAKAAASRYTSRGIDAWEVWNEPNIHNFWSPKPNAGAYATLLKATSAAIRTVNPRATILSGGLSPASTSSDGSTIAPIEFTKRLYAAGARSSFTAMAVHPYSFPYLPTTPNTSSWNAFAQLPLVHDVMAQNGDAAKQIWMTEVGAPTGSARDAVDDQRQAAIVTEAVTASNAWSWSGPAFVYAVRDAGTDPADREDNFGLVRRDFTPKPAFVALSKLLASDRLKAPAAARTSPVVPAPAPAVDAPQAPSATVAYAGSGVVRLRWMPSTAANVKGYNVYRTTEPPTASNRQWIRQTSSPLDGLAHNDYAVRAGVRYWYTTTAVTSVESVGSVEATAVPTQRRARRLGSPFGG